MSNPPLPMSPTKWFGRLMETLNTPAYEAAMQGLPSEGAALEIGFGTGKVVEMLLQYGRYQLVAGVDPTPDMVAFALNRRFVRQSGVRTDLRIGSADALPWPDRSFSVVLALHSFQFWPDPAAALTEIRRVLASGGMLRFVLRAHGSAPPQWLPNPISRSSDEIGGLVGALETLGFVVEAQISKITLVSAWAR